MIAKFIPKNEFARNILVLMTGTVISRAIPIGISPILTRLYTPEEFGVFALFMSLSLIISVIATGRYELAIMQPKFNKDVDNLAALSMLISFVIGVLLFLIVLVFNQEICELLDNEEISMWLYFVPLSVFLFGLSQSMSYWLNRRKLYKKIAASSVVMGLGTAGVNLGASKVSISSFGLIAGQLVGQLLSALYFARMIFKMEEARLRTVNKFKIIALAKKYSKFPKYSIFGAFLDNLSVQAPVLFVARIFNIASVGYFNFTLYIIGAPLALISGALAKILLQHVATGDPTKVFDLVFNVFVKLLLVAIPFVLVIFFFGEDLFEIIYGADWRIAGAYSKILCFMVAVRFIVSPLSAVFSLEKIIRIGILWQILYFIGIFITLFYAQSLDMEEFLIIFVLVDILLYLIYLGMIFYVAKRMKKCVV